MMMKLTNLLLLLWLCCLASLSSAFVVVPSSSSSSPLPSRTRIEGVNTHLFQSTSGSSSSSSSSSTSDTVASSDSSSSTTTTLPDIKSMRSRDMKQELQSYGIETASFLEKSELMEALTKARAEGLKPRKQTNKQTTTTSSSSSDSSSGSPATTSSTENDTRPREERLAEEMIKCQSMKASELKKELQECGISTKSFFEKSEFVKALAEARVDGKTATTRTRSTNNNASSTSEEGYAEYTNVEVITDDSAGPRPKTGGQEEQSRSRAVDPFEGANPFATGGGMAGGIADILKNMGMGGMAGRTSTSAAGNNPFGGSSPFGGANPFARGAAAAGSGAGGASPFGGNAFAKAQQMMSNPKVQQILAKAQANPSIMKKVNECMSNPASFAKYQNDPDVAELIQELRKYV